MLGTCSLCVQALCVSMSARQWTWARWRRQSQATCGPCAASVYGRGTWTRASPLAPTTSSCASSVAFRWGGARGEKRLWHTHTNTHTLTMSWPLGYHVAVKSSKIWYALNAEMCSTSDCLYQSVPSLSLPYISLSFTLSLSLPSCFPVCFDALSLSSFHNYDCSPLTSHQW